MLVTWQAAVAAVAIRYCVAEATAVRNSGVVGRVEHCEWPSRVQGGEPAQAPAAQYVRNYARLKHLASGSKRRFEHVAEDEAMANIEIAAAALLREVAGVLHETVRPAAEELLGGVVDRMGIRVCGVQRHSIAVTFFRRHLKSVVAGIGNIGTEFDWTERREGNDSSRRALRTEKLLIQVQQRCKVSAFGADVIRSENNVAR